MEPLHIAKKKDSLEVHFDPDAGILSLAGSSYPEDPVEFYSPLYVWLKQYIQDVNRPLTVNVTIDYLNTSSSKCILDFVEILEEYHQSGGEVALNWYYDKDDEDMEETWEELCEDLDLPYKLVPQ